MFRRWQENIGEGIRYKGKAHHCPLWLEPAHVGCIWKETYQDTYLAAEAFCFVKDFAILLKTFIYIKNNGHDDMRSFPDHAGLWHCT